MNKEVIEKQTVSQLLKQDPLFRNKVAAKLTVEWGSKGSRILIECNHLSYTPTTAV